MSPIIPSTVTWYDEVDNLLYSTEPPFIHPTTGDVVGTPRGLRRVTMCRSTWAANRTSIRVLLSHVDPAVLLTWNDELDELGYETGIGAKRGGTWSPSLEWGVRDE